MPWASAPGVRAVLVQFMPGQASGDALAALLLGDANPSGKLPLSFPAADNQTWLAQPGAAAYPGTEQPGTAEPRYVANYSEGLLMGYRWFDATGEERFQTPEMPDMFQVRCMAISADATESISNSVTSTPFASQNASLRNGSAMVLNDLQLVSATKARTIIVLARTHGEADVADAEVLRIILQLRALRGGLRGHVVRASEAGAREKHW